MNDELKACCFSSAFSVPTSAFRSGPRTEPLPLQPSSVSVRGGEDEAEARAAPRLALDLDVAAVLCEHLPDDDEAEAGAASARLRRVERVEDVRAHVLGHPRARVREFDDDAGPGVAVAVRRRRVGRRGARKLPAPGNRVRPVFAGVYDDLLEAAC